ncbi:MAG: elongation factor Ts [Minisyncoccia bacterium]
MISSIDIQKLRQETQAPVMECKKALEEASGDFEKAKIILKKKGELRAEKKQSNETKSGIVTSYIHANNRVGTLLELRCETDSVANNNDFKALAHDLAMHITAMNPQFISQESIPKEILDQKIKEYQDEIKDSQKPPEIMEKIIKGKLDKDLEEICLLNQIFVKDETKQIGELIKEATAKFGEKIEVARFIRYEI